MKYRKLIIRGISYSQTQSGAYILLLEDEQTSMKLPVIIGNFEAQSISLGLEKDLQPSRPLTHDLFSDFIKKTLYQPKSVIIYQILEGVFFSYLNFSHKETGEKLTLDARTSDAVAMAVRFNIPIYTTQEVLQEVGILLDIENPTSEEEKETDTIQDIISPFYDLDGFSLEELQSLLDIVVKNEDYDTAFEIQEAIKRKQNNL